MQVLNVQLTSTDLDLLEALAREATQGPWQLNVHTADVDSFDPLDDDWTITRQGEKTVIAWEQDGIQLAQDVRYMAAANPAVVMALIRRIREAQTPSVATEPERPAPDPAVSSFAGCLSLEEGKYTILHEQGANLRALRYGLPWRDLSGDGLILAMANEIEALRAQLLARQPQAA